MSPATGFSVASRTATPEPRVGGPGVDAKAGLARGAGRARIAAIADDQEPAPALGQHDGPIAPVQEAAAVAVEIEERGAPGHGRLVPADDRLAVFGRQRHILEVGQAGLARTDLLAPGRVKQRRLSQIEEGDDRGVAAERHEDKTEQKAHRLPSTNEAGRGHHSRLGKTASRSTRIGGIH
jgi:hypothetical protein